MRNLLENLLGLDFAGRNCVSCRLETAMDNCRCRHLFLGEEVVSGRVGQAGSVAHHRCDHDFRIYVQVPHHLSKDRPLKAVLLAEEYERRFDDVDHLGNARGHSSEIGGSIEARHFFSVVFDADIGGKTRRIHLFFRRRKYVIHIFMA